MSALTPDQEEFAQAIVRGESKADAYAKTHPKATRKSCIEQGSRMSRQRNIASRIESLKVLRVSTIEKAEAKAIQRAISKPILTPMRRLEILQEIADNPKEKASDRISAVHMDAKLKGELIDKTDLTTDGEALPAAMPSINLQMPTSFLARRGSSSS